MSSPTSTTPPDATTTPGLKNFVNGARTDARGGGSIALIDPATEDVYATAPLSTSEDVADAYRAAQAAFEVWGNTTPAERQLALFRIADAMEERRGVRGRRVEGHRQAARHARGG